MSGNGQAHDVTLIPEWLRPENQPLSSAQRDAQRERLIDHVTALTRQVNALTLDNARMKREHAQDIKDAAAALKFFNDTNATQSARLTNRSDVHSAFIASPFLARLRWLLTGH